MTLTAPILRPASTLVSVVYTSRAVTRFGDADLAVLLATSRRNNRRHGLTGLLLHREGRFMQVLEGPETAVHRALVMIDADARHDALRVVDEEHIGERRFGDWSMQYRPMTDEDESAWFGSADLPRADFATSRAAGLLERFRTR